jgi:hypothetical protein
MEHVVMQERYEQPLIGLGLKDSGIEQGCQMVCFQTKNPNLGNFWRALEWKMLIYFLVICNILRSF